MLSEHYKRLLYPEHEFGQSPSPEKFQEGVVVVLFSKCFVMSWNSFHKHVRTNLIDATINVGKETLKPMHC